MNANATFGRRTATAWKGIDQGADAQGAPRREAPLLLHDAYGSAAAPAARGCSSRTPAEMAKPDSERLPGVPGLPQGRPSGRSPRRRRSTRCRSGMLLTQWFEAMQAELPATDPVLKAALRAARRRTRPPPWSAARRSPPRRSAKALFKGGAPVVAASRIRSSLLATHHRSARRAVTQGTGRPGSTARRQQTRRWPGRCSRSTATAWRPTPPSRCASATAQVKRLPAERHHRAALHHLLRPVRPRRRLRRRAALRPAAKRGRQRRSKLDLQHAVQRGRARTTSSAATRAAR